MPLLKNKNNSNMPLKQETLSLMTRRGLSQIQKARAEARDEEES